MDDRRDSFVLIAEVENKLLTICQKVNRSNDDLEYLKHLIMKLPFFLQFQQNTLKDSSDKEILHELCNAMKLLYAREGEVVIKQGDISNDLFYIILKGGCAVVLKPHKIGYVSKQLESSDSSSVSSRSSEDEPQLEYYLAEKQQCKNKKKKKTIERKKKLTSEELKKINLEKIYKRYGIAKHFILPGYAFGEIALHSQNSLRTATIIASSPTIFLTLERDDFLKLGIESTKHKFLAKCIPNINQETSLKLIENISFFFKDQRLPKNQMVTKENYKGKYIYWLVEGECEISKMIKIKNKNHEQVEFQVDVAIITSGSIIGDEILFNKRYHQRKTDTIQHTKYQMKWEIGIYDYQVKISSIFARFYKIDKKILLSRFPDFMYDGLKTAYHQKTYKRTELIQDQKFKASMKIQLRKRPKYNEISKVEWLFQPNKVKEKPKNLYQLKYKSIQLNKQISSKCGKLQSKIQKYALLNQQNPDLDKSQLNKLHKKYKPFSRKIFTKYKPKLKLPNISAQKVSKKRSSSVGQKHKMLLPKDKNRKSQMPFFKQEKKIIHRIRKVKVLQSERISYNIKNCLLAKPRFKINRTKFLNDGQWKKMITSPNNPMPAKNSKYNQPNKNKIVKKKERISLQSPGLHRNNRLIKRYHRIKVDRNQSLSINQRKQSSHVRKISIQQNYVQIANNKFQQSLVNKTHDLVEISEARSKKFKVKKHKLSDTRAVTDVTHTQNLTPQLFQQVKNKFFISEPDQIFDLSFVKIKDAKPRLNLFDKDKITLKQIPKR